MYKKRKILVIIPARGGSKGIKNKNIRIFAKKPLIAHAIFQARKLKGADFRIIVSTEDKKIAEISKKYGAEIPFMRPKEMARDNSLIVDAVIYSLKKLKKDEGYKPDYILLLQTTSPLREIEDIYQCIKKIQTRNTDAVVTVCATHSLFYHLGKNGKLILVNFPKNKKYIKGNLLKGFKRQDFPQGYKLNGCFVYLIKYTTLMKEGTFFPKKTKAIISKTWRSVDIDTPEDFVMAKFLYKNKNKI